jgi:hypothetical protein
MRYGGLFFGRRAGARRLRRWRRRRRFGLKPAAAALRYRRTGGQGDQQNRSA